MLKLNFSFSSKKGLKLYINLSKGELDDPKNIMRDITGKGKWGNGDYDTIITDIDKLEYILSLIKQAI